MKISQKGLELIKRYEQGPGGGPALESYLCPAGVWTIGWGHTKEVGFGQHASEKQCEQFLQDDLAAAESAVTRSVSAPLLQREFDALVSFVFNLGSGNFFSSTLRKKVNRMDYASAAEEFVRWNKVNGVAMKGLTVRRFDERSLFLTGSF